MVHVVEIGMTEPMFDIALGARERVIGDNHLVTLNHQLVDEVRADEAGSACHQYAFLVLG